MGVVGEPLTRSCDLPHLKSRPQPSTRAHLFEMAYEDWNEIEGEDQDELQDASVGSHIPRLTYVLIQLPSSGSRVNVM